MFSRLTQFFDTQFAALMRGDFQTCVSDYDFPLALHIKGDWVVYNSPTAMMEAMASYRDGLLKTGTTALQCRVNAVDTPRKGRFRAWTTITHLDADQIQAAQTESLYFIREKRGRFLIEMVQCTRMPELELVSESPLMREIA